MNLEPPRAEMDTLTLRFDGRESDGTELHELRAAHVAEAQMSAIDFDNPRKWRVKTPTEKRAATVEDQEFLGRIANGLAVRKTDIFRLTVREDKVERSGRTRRTWTVLKVDSYRRAADDNDS